jgi:hypothetical protein
MSAKTNSQSLDGPKLMPPRIDERGQSKSPVLEKETFYAKEEK